ncbi:MAG: ABC transporter permease [Clostridia bacterium]|nr:ABC transporter permease [Clostridia bacterium]
MVKLLKYETRKLFKAKSFYIFLAVLAAYLFLAILLQQAVYGAMDKNDLANTILPTAASILQSALSSGLTTLILAIFTALFVCEDYADGTLKNICAKGFKRKTICCSKFIAVIIFALAACIVSWVCCYFFGSMFFESGTINGKVIVSLLAQLIVVLAYTAMYFAVSIVIRKTGGAIAGCIVAPMLVSLVLSIIDSLFNFENFSFTNYWLENLFSSAASGEKIVTTIVLSIIYAAVFTAAGIFINRKQEV